MKEKKMFEVSMRSKKTGKKVDATFEAYSKRQAVKIAIILNGKNYEILDKEPVVVSSHKRNILSKERKDAKTNNMSLNDYRNEVEYWENEGD